MEPFQVARRDIFSVRSGASQALPYHTPLCAATVPCPPVPGPVFILLLLSFLPRSLVYGKTETDWLARPHTLPRIPCPTYPAPHTLPFFLSNMPSGFEPATNMPPQPFDWPLGQAANMSDRKNCMKAGKHSPEKDPRKGPVLLGGAKSFSFENSTARIQTLSPPKPRFAPGA